MGAATDAPVMLPYQTRWVEDQAPVKVAEKSRRVGLTWAEAADDVLVAARATGGQDTWYVGYNQDMAREFIEAAAMWARAYDAAASEIEDAGDVLEDADRERGIQALRIRFASGHKIVALSSRPTNLRGKQGRVVLDEFAFHGDQEELVKAAMALLIWGGQVRIISTHDGEENAFNELIQDVRAGRKQFSLHRITFDDALGEGLYRRICKRLDRPWSREAEYVWRQEIMDFYGDGADEELFCIPRAGGGAYISGALIEARMQDDIPVLRWRCETSFAEEPKAVREAEALRWCEDHLAPLLDRLNPKLLSFFGEDFGRSGDLTVIWPLQLRQDLVRITPGVMELENVPFEQQRQVLFYIVDRLPRFMAGALDARGNGQYLSEVAMQRYGSGRIHQVMLSPEWYRENMPPYKAAFEDANIVLPRDADVLNDHRAVRMDRGVARVPETARSRGSRGEQRHGDSAIAGVLAYFASRTDPMEYDYMPAPRERDRFDERRPDERDASPRWRAGMRAY